MGFLPSQGNFAAIDIGSHTIRLIVASLDSGGVVIPRRIERRTTRLARNFQKGGTLDGAGMRESIAALKEYAEILREHDVRSIACGATGVVRKADNGMVLLDAVAELAGIRGGILSEDAEAFLSAKGMLSVLPERKGLILCFDLGGSSTEFLLVDTRTGEALWDTSVFIGAATITERFLHDDPPGATQVAQASYAIRETLEPAVSRARDFLRATENSVPFAVAGTAGTATTLAAISLEMTVYEPYRVNGLSLSEDWLASTIDRLADLPLSSRREIPGLEPGREDIILGGALIVRQILNGLHQKHFTVTDGGLLEGLLLDKIENELGLSSSLLTSLTWKLQKG